jgi:arylsulfatase A-like enzyme
MLSDIFPTILEIASIPKPGDRYLDGRSIMPILRGEDKMPDRPLFWRQNEQFAVRDGPWKLVVHLVGRGLFDLEDDLGETRDLSDGNSERVASMRRAFDSWCRDVDGEKQSGETTRFYPK